MKKFLAIILSVILVLSVMSIPAMADGTYSITVMALDSTDYNQGAQYGQGRSLGIDQYVAWNVVPEQTGTYEVICKYGSEKAIAKLQVNDADVSTIETSGEFATFKEHSFGTVQMIAGVNYKFKILCCSGGKSMYVNSLILNKISDEADIDIDLFWANRTTDKSADHLRKNKTATWDVYLPEDGNYKVEWNGKTNKGAGTFMTFTVDAQGNTIMGTAECKGNNVATDVVDAYGILPLRKGNTTITLKNISTLYDNAHNTVTIYPTKLRISKVSEYDTLEAHSMTVNFTNSIEQGVGASISTTSRLGISEDMWEKWIINVPESGAYDIYFYGGAQGKDDTITNPLTYCISVYGDKIEGETKIVDPPKGSANAGWNRRVLTKVGNMKLNKGANPLFYKVTSKDNSTFDSSANLLYFVRTETCNYEYKPSAEIFTNIFPYEQGGMEKYFGEAIPKNLVPPYANLNLALVLYDEKDGMENMVDCVVGTLFYYEQRQCSVSLPKPTSEYEFTKAKLLVWEEGTMLPLAKACEETKEQIYK